MLALIAVLWLMLITLTVFEGLTNAAAMLFLLWLVYLVLVAVVLSGDERQAPDSPRRGPPYDGFRP